MNNKLKKHIYKLRIAAEFEPATSAFLVQATQMYFI